MSKLIFLSKIQFSPSLKNPLKVLIIFPFILINSDSNTYMLIFINNTY